MTDDILDRAREMLEATYDGNIADICTALLAADERARALAEALQECMGCMDSLRDFVAEGGSRQMIGASSAIRDANATLTRAHALLRARGQAKADAGSGE